MKTFVASLLATSLILNVIGCSRESPRGGPGAKTTTTTTTNEGKTSTESTNENRADTFKVKVPAEATNITQGKTHEVTIALDRGRDFKQAVKLKFEAPKGVVVTPPETTIQSGENKITVSVEASDNAEVGRHTITVMGIPDQGTKTSVNMDIDVKRRN